MKENFVNWLTAEMERRHWSVGDLAHASKIHPSTLSNILNENRKAGPDICRALAKGLSVSETMVFYKAGLLSKDPSDPTQQLSPLAHQLITMIEDRPESQQKAALATIEALFEALDN